MSTIDKALVAASAGIAVMVSVVGVISISTASTFSAMLGAVIFILLMITFFSRLIWFSHFKLRGYRFQDAGEALKPERIMILGTMIALITDNLSSALGITGSDGNGQLWTWVISLIMMLPVYEVYVTSWGKMKMVHGEDNRITSWPMPSAPIDVKESDLETSDR